MKFRFTFLVILALITFGIQPTNAQFSKLFGKDKYADENGARKRKRFTPHSYVSFGIGTSSYYGDIHPYSQIISSTINDIQWNVALNFNRQLNEKFSLGFGATYARIAGDDRHMEGNSTYAFNFLRNLQFRNDLVEFSVRGQYDFIAMTNSIERRSKLTPYVFAGIAVLTNNPMGLIPSQQINDTTVTLAGKDVTFIQYEQPKSWTSLRELGTEGQGRNTYEKPYSGIAAAVLIGTGIRYKLTKSFDLGAEIGYRYTTTDYLDDVGGKFATITDISEAKAKVAANRMYEATYVANGNSRINEVIDLKTNSPLTSIKEFGEAGKARGSGSLFNDGYLLTNFRIIYHIPAKIKCPGN